MDAETKKQITEMIREYYKKVFPEYPTVRQPRQALTHLSKIYRILEEKKLIDNTQISYAHFEAIAVDKFQEMQLNEAIANFF